MTTRETLENKQSFIEQTLGVLKRLKKHPDEELISHEVLRGALERYLFLAVQGSIDLAEGFVAYHNLRKPISYKDAFTILREEELLPYALCESLESMVGFRNIIVHDYIKVDPNQLLKILHHDIKDISDFLAIIETNL